MDAIIGKKIIQAEAFLTNGVRIPVTKIDVSNNTVLEIKNVEKHGYNAVQIGFGVRKNSKKPILGHVKKANLKSAPLLIREVSFTASDTGINKGDKINIESILKPGDIVKVTGISKGKGFAGVVKRHNFRGGPRTHGQSDRERAPGSIGQTTTPGRVYKGKRMAGRMGNEKSSALNLQIVGIEVIGNKTIVLVKGLVPGSVNSLVTIKKTGELPVKKFVPLLQNDAENDVMNNKILETNESEMKQEDQKLESVNKAESDLTHSENTYQSAKDHEAKDENFLSDETTESK